MLSALLIVYSFHHRNTEKIAQALAEVLNAEIRTPQSVAPEGLQACDLVGFGSGIYSDQHHESLLDLADSLLQVADKQAFIFSTSGAPAFALDGGAMEDYVVKAHAPLRERLKSKGYQVVGEFMCPGWNTYAFLKLLGGINRGRPNAEDLERARAFAQRLKAPAM